MNFYEQLFCRGRTTGEGMTHFERLFAAKFGGSPPPEVREYTGAVPVTITADGTPLLDYLISGNMVQNGTPTPTNPIQPSECGERTENLFIQKLAGVTIDSSGAIVSDANYDTYIAEVSDGETYTVGNVTGTQVFGFFTTKPALGTITYNSSRTIFSTSSQTLTVPTGESIKYIGVRYNTGVSNAMFNTGSTAKPFEPYGYKIPISSASTTTPVYLGVVETTRKIKKLVLTGEEDITYDATNKHFSFALSPTAINSLYTVISSHFQTLQDNPNLGIVVTNSGARIRIYDVNSIWSSANDFKTYLTQQYANGTPVTVWYVLATETTGIVNEPIRKIGDYADTVSKEQAGVQIPTNNGSTTVDVETTLKPSEVYIKYMG